MASGLMALGAGCGSETVQDGGAPAGPPLPPLALRPMLGELRQLAAAHAPPPEAVQRNLHELAEIALQLTDADPRTAARAERTLLEHPQAWFALEPALAHTDAAVRRRAAWLCGSSGQTVLQLPLVLRLKYEPDPETVVWIADAVQRLGNDSGLAWLDAAIAHEATADAAGPLAVQALIDRGIELGEQPTWAELRQHLQALHRRWLATGTPSRRDAAPPDPAQLEARLAFHLQTPDGWQLRPVDDARYVLRLLGRLAVPMLARTTSAAEPYIRTMPLQVLADLGHAAREAAPAVLPLLGDPLTASYAVRALGEIGATEMLPYLRPLLADRDTEQRAAAAQAVGMLGDQDSRNRLEQLLAAATEAQDVRVAAAFGLLCLGPHPAAAAHLAERERLKDYHEPTLQRLRERLAQRG